MSGDLDELRIFVEDRLRAADPSIDTSPGSQYDTEVLKPILERFGPDLFDTPIREFILARITSEFPELILQDGDPIDDYGARIMRILLEPFRRHINKVAVAQSIANPRLLSDLDVDNHGANLFEKRRQGSFSVGVARLLFSSPQFALATPTNVVFTNGGLRFFPVENQSIPAENMLFNVDGSLYYFDIIVRAEIQGKESDIEPNTLIGIEGVPAVVQVKNLSRFADGGDRETSEEFLARIESGLTEKSLVTLRGIRARLLGIFENVRAITVIGYQDPEMKRDVITGAEGVTYAFAQCFAASGDSTIALSGTAIADGVATHNDFTSVGVAVGDIISRLDTATKRITEFTVTEVISPIKLRVTPVPETLVVATPHWLQSRTRGKLFLSDIPGGILVPETRFGEITVNNNQVHIGGMADIFVRAGAPQERLINVPAIRDGEPLHLGLDLESFGGRADELVQITPTISNAATTTAAFAGPADVELLIKVFDAGDSTVPWDPSTTDVGRFIELLGTTEFRVYEIKSIGELLVQGGIKARRVKVSVFDQNTQGNLGVSSHAGVFNLNIRLLEKVSIKNRVRDRAVPVANFGAGIDGLQVVVGDSLVIESGSDAGIYSVRRVASHLAANDTLILDRDLTATVTPTGSGTGTGLRYRIADSIELDLVSPRAVKIPIGGIFLGEDLQTVAGSEVVFSSAATDFLLAGLEAGDTLEILEGDNKGVYGILSVNANSLELDGPVASSGFQVSYTVYRAFVGIERPLVRVKEIELLDSSNQPTGIQVPYGKEVDIRILGTLSNRAQGSIVESFQGGIAAMGTTITDADIDFVARGILPGYRLEVLSGTNIGAYEVLSVLGVHALSVQPASAGGKDFDAIDTSVHYRIGQPSTGIARIYFKDPTSVEINTGLAGGRLLHRDSIATRGFRFSEVDGYAILPAHGEDTENKRDLRVVRSYDAGGGTFFSILELMGPDSPDVFDLELETGDIVEVFEPVPFLTSGSLEIGAVAVPIFGNISGLHTVAGSNRVTIPDNSRVDFTQMPLLAGELLYINSGPDTGQYAVQRVEGAKALILDSIMSTSTENIEGRDINALDAVLQLSGSDVFLRDVADFMQLGAVGDYITIIEAVDPLLEGTFRIDFVDTTNFRVRLVGFPTALVPVSAGNFSWIRTGPDSLNGTIQQPFSLYKRVPKELVIAEVATKAPDVKPLAYANPGITSTTTFTGTASEFSGVVAGDRLEVLRGASAGIYPIQTATSSVLTIFSAHPFAAPEPNVAYRIWAGVHGSRRMVTVGSWDSSNARVRPGALIPYRIRRPDVLRVSATEMQGQVDGGLYYVDVQIESLAPSDSNNLGKSTPLERLSGVRVDGFVYRVENNTLTFSPYEEVTLSFQRRFLPVGNSDLPENHIELSNRNIQIRYENSPTVKIINDLFHSDAERPVNANSIARHFLPAYVLTTLRYRGGSSAAVVGPEIENYINGLGPFDDLEVSDVEAFIQRRGANSITHPIVLVALTHDLDRKLTVRRSDNKISADATAYNGTSRITSYFATLDEGLVVERQ